jgi:hypothetical protein
MDQHITVRNTWQTSVKAVGIGNADQFHDVPSIRNELAMSPLSI